MELQEFAKAVVATELEKEGGVGGELLKSLRAVKAAGLPTSEAKSRLLLETLIGSKRNLASALKGPMGKVTGAAKGFGTALKGGQAAKSKATYEGAMRQLKGGIMSPKGKAKLGKKVGDLATKAKSEARKTLAARGATGAAAAGLGYGGYRVAKG